MNGMFKFVILLAAVVGALSGVVPPGLQAQLEGRIVDGHPASISSFPHQISLQSGGYHSCGGSIISEQIVVTAAHCVYGANANLLKVRAGSSQWISGGVLVGVKSLKWHERYNPYTLTDDIAIMRLNSSLVFSSTIRPIKLATEDPSDDAIGVVSGWGTTKYLSNSSPTQLKYVEMKILSREECGSGAYNYGAMKISASMICTYHVGKDSCQGDSGGPLISANKLVGVVSWGMGCAFEDYPGVYTNVAYMQNWILKTKADLEKEP